MGNLLKGIQTATLKKDTRSLCGTKHTVKAEATGPTAGKDTILVSYKLESTSGWLKTDYHTGDGYLHKIRITIFKDGEIAYQQDVAGDDSGKFITLPPFLITNEGKWEITAKSIAAGDCAKPTGEKNFGYLYAKQPEPVEEDNQETTVNPNDLTPILSVGMIGLAGLVFSKILRKKRKDAETFEAPNTPNYKTVMDFISEAAYDSKSEAYKLLKEMGEDKKGRGFQIQDYWIVYAYLEWMKISEKGFVHPEYGKNFTPIRPGIKRRGDVKSIFIWIRRNQNKSMPLFILNDKRFFNGFKEARKRYVMQNKQKGSLFGTNWIVYGKRIFYYKTPDAIDKTALITSTNVYPLTNEIAKKEFENLTVQQKKGLLKDDEEEFFKIRAKKNAETFEAPKKPRYKKVMEIIKQILYEPNSEQYKLMQEWDSEHRRLHQMWLVYAYCQLKNQIPTDVKQRKISSQMRWLKRNWKGMANSEMLNDKQFTVGFNMARNKYGVKYEQEGFRPIPTNWIIYDEKIFYYATPGLLDKTAIITGTEVYSIKDGQAKEAFNSLEKEKKKALLKKDKKAFF
jgi:hypothetical protein